MRLLLAVLLFAEVLTNADVIKLVQAGLSPATVEAKIASSDAKFDTSTDALVALAKANVPDSVIRAMIAKSPARTNQQPATSNRSVTRRYDAAIHRTQHAKCEGELRIDGKGIKATRCKDLDFDLAWSDVTRICYDYGFRGTIVLETASAKRRVSTTTPAEAKRMLDTIRENRPAIPQASGCVE